MNMISDWVTNYGLAVAVTLLVGVLLYVIGTAIVGHIVTNAVERTHSRNWPQKDVEKRQKTLLSLFTTLWQFVVVAGVAVFLIEKLFPNVTLAPLFASAGIVGVA